MVYESILSWILGSPCESATVSTFIQHTQPELNNQTKRGGSFYTDSARARELFSVVASSTKSSVRSRMVAGDVNKTGYIWHIPFQRSGKKTNYFGWWAIATLFVMYRQVSWRNHCRTVHANLEHGVKELVHRLSAGAPLFVNDLWLEVDPNKHTILNISVTDPDLNFAFEAAKSRGDIPRQIALVDQYYLLTDTKLTYKERPSRALRPVLENNERTNSLVDLLSYVARAGYIFSPQQNRAWPTFEACRVDLRSTLGAINTTFKKEPDGKFTAEKAHTLCGQLSAAGKASLLQLFFEVLITELTLVLQLMFVRCLLPSSWSNNLNKLLGMLFNNTGPEELATMKKFVRQHNHPVAADAFIAALNAGLNDSDLLDLTDLKLPVVSITCNHAADAFYAKLFGNIRHDSWGTGQTAPFINLGTLPKSHEGILLLHHINLTPVRELTRLVNYLRSGVISIYAESEDGSSSTLHVRVNHVIVRPFLTLISLDPMNTCSTELTHVVTSLTKLKYAPYLPFTEQNTLLLARMYKSVLNKPVTNSALATLVHMSFDARKNMYDSMPALMLNLCVVLSGKETFEEIDNVALKKYFNEVGVLQKIPETPSFHKITCFLDTGLPEPEVSEICANYIHNETEYPLYAYAVHTFGPQVADALGKIGIDKLYNYTLDYSKKVVSHRCGSTAYLVAILAKHYRLVPRAPLLITGSVLGEEPISLVQMLGCMHALEKGYLVLSFAEGPVIPHSTTYSTLSQLLEKAYFATNDLKRALAATEVFKTQ